MKKSLIAVVPLMFLVLGGATCFPDAPSDAAEAGVIPILRVQGKAHRSPLEGQTVTVEGNVIAVRASSRVNGFWLQDSWRGDEESHVPANWIDRKRDPMPASSGVFVRTGESPAVSLGDWIRVTGVVREAEREGQLSVTEIEALTIARPERTGPEAEPVRLGAPTNPIPDQIDDDGLTLYEPNQDAIDFFESVEGMLVEIGRATVVGPTSRFGDFVVIPNAEAGDLTRTARGGILLDDSIGDGGKILVDASLLSTRPTVAVGDVVESLRGIIHYDFGSYRLLAASVPEIERSEAAAPAIPPATPGSLSVATYNVLNLSAANPQRRFDAVARSIVESLDSPDVIALQEIQDDTGEADDGVVSAEKTLARLVDAIEGVGGPRYAWRQIDPLDSADGGAPGSNIRVAYLIDTSQVSIVDRGKGGPSDEVAIEGEGKNVRLSLSPGRLGTATDCFLGQGSSDESEGTRKSLALEIEHGGETYFLINNHLKSKRGDDGGFGIVQPPLRRTEQQRACQTLLVANLAREILRRNPEANLIVLGDMNEHEFRPPMRHFTDAGLISMIESVPKEERYTYNYLGNSQVLDHVYVSPALEERSTAFIPHPNSDSPEDLAASDHDPVLLIVEPR